MKIKLFLTLITALLMIGLTQNTQANFYLNPGFELDENDDAWPDDWDLWAGGGGDWNYYEDDPDGAHGGDDYVELMSGSGGWSGFHQYNLAITEDDTDVVIGCWVRDDGNNTHGIYFKFEFYDEPVPVGADDAWKAIHLIISPAPEWALETAGDGLWNFYEYTMPVPAGTVSFTPVVVGWDMGRNVSFFLDDAYGDIGTYVPAPTRATNPVPPNGGFAMPNIEQLSWTNPEHINPEDTDPILVDVYFDPNATYDPENPTKILTLQDTNFVNLASAGVTLQMDSEYVWRVDCWDPNGGSPLYTKGDEWSFDTFNRPPTVDAGLNQEAWLSAGSVAVQLDAAASDEGLPLDPGMLTYSWTIESGPDIPLFDDDTVEDPIVTFDTEGDYILKLTADDSILTGEDTVIISVHAEGYTGLVAYWQLDEAAGLVAEDIIGGHDGDLMGDPVWMPADGQVAGALQLDGDGDYIEIGDSYHTSQVTWADLLTEKLTLSCWFKTNEGSFGDSWAGLVCKGSDAWRIQRNSNTDTVEFAIAGIDNGYVTASINVNDGQWHHVVGAYTGDMMHIYVDAILADSVEVSSPCVPGTVPLWIGAGQNVDYPDEDYQLNGMIDQVKIYEIGLPIEKVIEDFRNDGGHNSCGGDYATGDINEDCYVNIDDLAEMVTVWLECRDITNPDCTYTILE